MMYLPGKRLKPLPLCFGVVASLMLGPTTHLGASTRAEAMFQQGTDHLDNGRFEKAIKVFEKIERLDDVPDEIAIGSRFGLARSQINLGRPEAVETARSILEMVDQDAYRAAGYNLLGIALSQDWHRSARHIGAAFEMWNEAERAFRSALAAPDVDVNAARIGLAQVLAWKGDTNREARALVQAYLDRGGAHSPPIDDLIEWLDAIASTPIVDGLSLQSPLLDADQRELFRPPKRIATASPQYTEEARKRRVNGSVWLRLLIDEFGEVSHSLVLKGMPFGMTDSVVRTAGDWRYTPAQLDGNDIAYQLIVTTNFSLQ